MNIFFLLPKSLGRSVIRKHMSQRWNLAQLYIVQPKEYTLYLWRILTSSKINCGEKYSREQVDALLKYSFHSKQHSVI